MNMYAYMLLRSTTQYYVVIELRSTSNRLLLLLVRWGAGQGMVGDQGTILWGSGGGGPRNVQRAPMYAPYHKRDTAECGMAGAAASAYVSECPYLDPSGWESPSALAENSCQQPGQGR